MLCNFFPSDSIRLLVITEPHLLVTNLICLCFYGVLRSCRQAADLFIGQHDFTHFANLGNPDPNPVKTIRRFDILPNEYGFVFQVEGSGFMYKMVYLSTLVLLLLPTVISKQCKRALVLVS